MFHRVTVVLLCTALTACGTANGSGGGACKDMRPYARVVFDGIMLPGPTVPHGLLTSPARVRVIHYLKGNGPAIVRVETGSRHDPDGAVRGGEGIAPRAGERWRIYTQGRSQPYPTSVCAGSTRIGAR